MVLNLIVNNDMVKVDLKKIKKRLIDRQIAWNYILSRRLRELDPLTGMEDYFSEEDFHFIGSVDNPNQAILYQQTRDLSELLDRKNLSDLHHIELEECLQSIEDSLGKVERIKNTHFPVIYDHLIQLSIYFFAVLLAFAIVDSSHLFEVIFTVLISGIFLALERIAREMQDPFEDLPSDTPMTHISYSIERGALQMQGEGNMPPAPERGKFYIK